jgi:hypothetical protein
MKTLAIGVIFGLFGAIAVSVSFAAQWPTWVMFVAWVSYYLFGKTLKGSFNAFIQIVLGFAMGLVIQLTGTWLNGRVGGVGLPVAVFFLIGSLAFISKIKSLSNIPAWFLGLIVFFGLHPKLELVALAETCIPIVFGFLFAWLNDSAVNYVHRLANSSVK